ncbi:MAG: prolyl oligopeptidase family serine peptidase [Acidobacteriota bacterium]
MKIFATLLARCSVVLLLSASMACTAGPEAPAPGATAGSLPQTVYLTPPQEIVDILDAAPPPRVSVSPDGRYLLKTTSLSMPTIEQLAQPVLGLAGVRVNPQNTGPASPSLIVGLTLVTIDDASEREIELPSGARLSSISWSPDGNHFGFVLVELDRLTQWVVDVRTGEARVITGSALNGVAGPPCAWMPDNRDMVCRTVPADRGPAPQRPEVAVGPTVLEASGPAAPVRTFRNLLENETEEALFDYYFSSQLAIVSIDNAAQRPIGEPAIFSTVRPSPDGSTLLVARVTRPYSYLVTLRSFPQEIEVWDTDGKTIAHLQSQPLAEDVPIGGVRRGMRSIRWRPGADSTLVYAEALDDGDPRRQVEHRDRIVVLAAPFDGERHVLAQTQFRYRGMSWTAEGNTALVRTSDRRSRRSRTWLLEAGSDDELRLLWDRRSADRYGDPGTPRTTLTARGERVLLQAPDGDLFLAGDGASPQGDRPFLDRMDLATLETERLFQTGPEAYETVVEVLDDRGRRLLTRRESKTEPPNYFLRSEDREPLQLTHYEDPAPQLASIDKQLLTYDRGDGVKLSGTLILPPGYQQGERLPLVLWIYPREFTSAATASQVRGSPYRFTRPRGASHLFFLMQGYAVLDGPTLPVIGRGETANNTYIEQTARGAKAAIDKVVSMGVADPNRVGVGGHSYGAFATAHLLAATDLFRAGISRSGAFNRTLTPFGFQNERRTLWQDKGLYTYISPFMHADEINEPLLMFHGQSDTNSGTFPIQSDRMYHAIKGHGGTVTLVKYPYEGHGYRGRESVHDCVARMIDWFDRYVKNATDS